MKPYLLPLLCLFILGSTNVRAQSLIDKVTDLMEFNIGKTPEDTSAFQTKIVFAPIVYYEPNTSFGFGFGASLLFKPRGAGPETRTSNIPVGISYTLNNQVFFTSGYTVFFPQEKWIFRGNLDYTDFPRDYFGIGNGTTEEDRSVITYQQILVEPLLLRQVLPKIFVGGGFRYDRFYNTELLEATDLLPEGANLQDSLGSTSFGLEFAASYDNRDNVVNAQRGTLVEFTQGFYGKSLGGSNTFQLSKVDVRGYKRTGKKGVVALNAFARYAAGDPPPYEMSELGGDFLLRGFPEGRFRDRLALFAQAEYRWQTWRSIGFVFYGGAGQVAEGAADLGFDQLRYSLGTGLRVLIIPSENINLRLDYAYGFGLSSGSGFYLGLGEAF
ncbi:BamA/TamA family outer membrane protein [Neolewinella aurantiaca]|uniref:BamA/TamA family outer membrane protein n=1 Tax=Neolewinella aurantiaca TaxID=2602767 RepID=A0A5C7FRK0_9BACT|nr:BamA/TamA family outer membrane protein [Neolewinella aurantiaca]TXF88741.1 BamA/TamA family outer membrane protein [Neolewinella aurantiaca]